MEITGDLFNLVHPQEWHLVVANENGSTKHFQVGGMHPNGMLSSYCPQRQGNVFTPVCHSVRGGCLPSACWDTPPWAHTHMILVLTNHNAGKLLSVLPKVKLSRRNRKFRGNRPLLRSHIIKVINCLKTHLNGFDDLHSRHQQLPHQV